MNKIAFIFLSFLITLSSCSQNTNEKNLENILDSILAYRNMLKLYHETVLDLDYSALSEQEKQMILVFIEISRIIDEMFWYQSFGNKDSLWQYTR